MIPPAPSPSVRNQSPAAACMDDVTTLDLCTATSVAVDVLALVCRTNDDVTAKTPLRVVGRKRVTFADDGDDDYDITARTSSRQRMTSHRSLLIKRRRMCPPIFHDVEQQHVELSATRLNDRASMPLQSISCNHGTSKSRLITSSPSEDHQQTVPVTALPVDPRVWTPSDVHTWLRQVTRLAYTFQQQQQPIEVDVERFRMNGKALCLMTSDMFAYRVPHGGHLLYKDFQARLCRAVAISLHRNCASTEQ